MDIFEQVTGITTVEHEYCKYCGKKLWHNSCCKLRKFCSDKCRKASWYRNHKDGPMQSNPNRITERQRDNIRIFRNIGFGYQKIANDLGLKKHQVRDYCRYHGLVGNANEKMITTLKEKFSPSKKLNPKNYCWNCGRETKITRKYCSDKCRYDYNNKRRAKCDKA